MRESLFELLGLRIVNARFLDLCSGSGAVGIEALSRGAGHATFVDRSARVCTFVKSNLELCGVPPEQSDVVKDEAAHFLGSGLKKDAYWDIIFFDPPYTADYFSVIETISVAGLLKKKRSVLVVEHSFKNELSDKLDRLHRWRVICHGESCLSFYERKK